MEGLWSVDGGCSGGVGMCVGLRCSGVGATGLRCSGVGVGSLRSEAELQPPSGAAACVA